MTIQESDWTKSWEAWVKRPITPTGTQWAYVNSNLFEERLKDEIPNQIKLGDVLLDLGCGPIPVSLRTEVQDKILLDLPNCINNIGFNPKLEQIGVLYPIGCNLNSITPQKDHREIYGEDLPFTGDKEFLDSIICSQVLNYIDYKKVLLRFVADLKIGGNIFIFNRANFGDERYFHSKRPQNEYEVEKFFQNELRMKRSYQDNEYPDYIFGYQKVN